jgi:hypothetical protein
MFRIAPIAFAALLITAGGQAQTTTTHTFMNGDVQTTYPDGSRSLSHRYMNGDVQINFSGGGHALTHRFLNGDTATTFTPGHSPHR